MPADRAALGAFLRSRRDRLTPAQAGIQPFPGPRRVKGLRKEELAVLAGMSSDYYSRLEQGRQANVSRDVLDALARALRLDATEHAHLLDLAAPTVSSRRAVGSVSQRPDPGLLRLMTALDHLPVLLLGARAEVLATNALLRAVLRDLDVGSSFLTFLFGDPLARERIVNWASIAATAVAGLRLELGRHPDDHRLTALIETLRADVDVARWWDDHGVRDVASLTKHVRHPVAGDLYFDIESVCTPHDLDQRLVIYTASPDSPTYRLLPMLASWQQQVPVRSG